MKCRSEKPLPPVFSVSFVVIFGGVVVFGHRESVGKLKKKIFPIFPTSPARAQGICPIFFLLKNISYLVI